MGWLWIVWAIVLVFGLVVIRGAPYVPSRKRYLDKAFTNLYALTKNDVLVDIGSGDGVVLRAASRYGATAIGYEINPILVIISHILSRGTKRVRTILADAWLSDFPSNTTVVYVFTASLYVKKVEQKMQKEALRLGRPLKLILYGNSLSGKNAENKTSGYSLYTFSPLQ